MKFAYKIITGILAFLVVATAALALLISHHSACGPAPMVASGAETMQAIVYRCYGSADVLKLETIEKPVPSDNAVLVKVHAASVNPLDWHYMRGSPYIMRLGTGLGSPDDTRIGVDFAGTVEAVGKNVARFKPGDEVFGGRTGAFAEYVTVTEDRALAIKPANITFVQAAAVPIAAVTALQALRDRGKIKPGQKVLINGASGGVGTFAVQIAKSLGAEVHGVCSTRNVAMVRSIGADHVFDYTTDDYTESANQYDLIVDMISNHSLAKNRRVLSTDGKLVMIGGPKGNWLKPLTGPVKAMLLSPFVDQEIGVMVAELRQEDLEFLADLMQSGHMTPIIDREYRLSEVPDAIEYSEQGRARGKIVISLQ
jgi:NADPH:quinone reductase-like Zn-dependent oxidoreductase